MFSESKRCNKKMFLSEKLVFKEQKIYQFKTRKFIQYVRTY